jgi:hypothetical protein
VTFSGPTRFGENPTFGQVFYWNFMKAIFFVVMGNKSEKKRWLYEPFPSSPRKDLGVKRYGMAFFLIVRKSAVKGFLGGHFLFLKI